MSQVVDERKDPAAKSWTEALGPVDEEIVGKLEKKKDVPPFPCFITFFANKSHIKLGLTQTAQLSIIFYGNSVMLHSLERPV